MFGFKRKIESVFLKRIFSQELSKSPISLLENILIVSFLRCQLIKEVKQIDVQSPIAKKSNKYSTLVLRFLADFMPNNLGNWTDTEPFTIAGKIEGECIQLVKKAFGAPLTTKGHLSSGSTEGNIYATWVGRNYLQKTLELDSTQKIIVLKSSLAHYSIDKAANICGLQMIELAIDDLKWNIDLGGLSRTIEILYAKGIRGFLIPVTLGYTVTGTSDDIAAVNRFVKQVKKIHPDCGFFLWIDAAFSGLSQYFLSTKFRPFLSSEIQLVTVDFHKLLAVQYPGGILLYRPSLLRYIQKGIPYINNQRDTTLLGSRPGLNAIASWLSVKNMFTDQFRLIFNQALAKKNEYLANVKQIMKDIQIISDKTSLQCGLVVKGKKQEKEIKERLRLTTFDYRLLFSSGHKQIKICKLFFLPKF